MDSLVSPSRRPEPSSRAKRGRSEGAARGTSFRCGRAGKPVVPSETREATRPCRDAANSPASLTRRSHPPFSPVVQSAAPVNPSSRVKRGRRLGPAATRRTHPLFSPAVLTRSSHPLLSPAVLTRRSHPLFSPAVLTRFSHPPFSPAVLTRFSHPPFSPASLTRCSHPPFSPAVLTRRSHPLFSPASLTRRSHPLFSPAVLTAFPRRSVPSRTAGR
jgi:hypothetical protein